MAYHATGSDATSVDRAGPACAHILGILSNRICKGAATLRDAAHAVSPGWSVRPARLAGAGPLCQVRARGWSAILLTIMYLELLISFLGLSNAPADEQVAGEIGT
jgi:hypothetical protein